MKITNEQLDYIATQIQKLKEQEQSKQEHVQTESAPSNDNKPDEVKTEQTKEAVTPPIVKPETPTLVVLGTPPASNNTMGVDSLNSKSVEWMAQNITDVNKLIEGNN